MASSATESHWARWARPFPERRLCSDFPVGMLCPYSLSLLLFPPTLGFSKNLQPALFLGNVWPELILAPEGAISSSPAQRARCPCLPAAGAFLPGGSGGGSGSGGLAALSLQVTRITPRSPQFGDASISGPQERNPVSFHAHGGPCIFCCSENRNQG